MNNDDVMEKLEILGVSLVTGLISIVILYYTFSKNVKKFYEETNEIDPTGVVIVVGWIFLGFYKIFREIFPTHYLLALRIVMFLFGGIFLGISILIWFVN